MHTESLCYLSEPLLLELLSEIFFSAFLFFDFLDLLKENIIRSSNIERRLREASHIDFFYDKRHMFVWGWGFAAVTFLCKHHGKIW
jgi:hypothetical protein